ncbi:hypothetical protein ABIC08_006384 [Bradyrhizobium sp. RT9b]|uniref:TrlF family AAA-like ATPase n=1 Tax=Bradyrhizobium sp. RT9b TaxID=3156385 RepID=UPI00339920F9
MNFDIGSIWRKWDPHVHTPGSILADNFVGGWEPYLAAIEGQNEVQALGITDYMSIANYRQMRKFRADGRIPNIRMMLPNIEFRITPKTRDGRAINIHLLVSPDDPNHEDEIENALGRLSIEFNGRTYSCQHVQLIALGKVIQPEISGDTAALREGVNQFKIEFDAFRTWLKDEGWLRRNSLVAIAAGSNDGASGIQHDDGFRAFREELYRFSDMIFSGNPADRDYWLGKSHGGQTVSVYGSPKPCIHGSDAHELAKLFKPDHNRFCWIKADLTFEGLRQVVYEPEDRVWIGEEPPTLHDKSRTLAAVKLSDVDWFETATYSLNPGLVAIIGQKGMGKSAINDLVAYAAGSWQDADKDSFIDRARPHIKGMSIGLVWGDGRETAVNVTAKGAASEKREVRYLSQKFVERLCADHAANGELTREIEAVIFAYLNPTETLNASNFHDLREKRTSGVIAEQRRLQEDLRRLHREISDLYNRRLSIPERRAKEAALLKEREGVVSQIPPATSDEEAKVAAELQTERDALAKLIDLVGTQRETLLRLDQLAEKFAAFQGEMDRFWNGIAPELRTLAIPEEHWNAFRPSFQGDVAAPIDHRKAEISASITQLEGDVTSPAHGTLHFHQTRVRQLSALTTADEAKRSRIVDLQNRIAAIDTELRRARNEIDTIEGPESEQLSSLRMQRRSTYYAYFDTLDKERKILAELYEPLQQHLSLGEQQERHLDFAIRQNVDLDGWIEKGARLFNQRKRLPYPTQDDMAAAATEHLLPAWKSGSHSELEEGLNKFLQPYGEAGTTVGDYLKPSQTVADFFDWLYSTDHISLTYGLSYNSTPLENLSPGTKGIVLLILYLAMDKKDTRPLLIDQPEENLDNESIYSLLASYFRKAKLRRQILLITHNPNLVVNTDAEQVIVAHCVKENGGLPSFSYSAGALEDCENIQSTQHQVCRILEGGAAAFQKRERRYSLDG